MRVRHRHRSRRAVRHCCRTAGDDRCPQRARIRLRHGVLARRQVGERQRSAVVVCRLAALETRAIHADLEGLGRVGRVAVPVHDLRHGEIAKLALVAEVDTGCDLAPVN